MTTPGRDDTTAAHDARTARHIRSLVAKVNEHTGREALTAESAYEAVVAAARDTDHPPTKETAMPVMQQNDDGTWTPAEPIRPPLLVRWEIALRHWWRNR